MRKMRTEWGGEGMVIRNGGSKNSTSTPYLVKNERSLRTYLLLLKEISLISSNITRVKTGIKQHAKVEYCGARRRDTHITDPAQRYVHPLFFLLLLKEISSI